MSAAMLLRNFPWFILPVLGTLAVGCGSDRKWGSSEDNNHNTGGHHSGSGGSGNETSSGGTTNPSGGSGGNGSGGDSNTHACAVDLQGTSQAKIRTVGYLPTYRGQLAHWSIQLDFSKVSYVNIAFADVDAEGNLSLADTGVCAFVDAAHKAGVKVCPAIGGAGTIDHPGVFAHLLQAANRGGFIEKISEFLEAYNFDCFDVDLEGAGITADYADFISDVAAKLKPQGKELTAAIAKWMDKAALTNALSHFDFVNVMSYDLCPFWQGSPCQHSSWAAMTEELTYWTNKGVAASKIVVGVPFYGYRWTPSASQGSAMLWSEIVQAYPASLQQDEINDNGTQIFYNGISTIQAKAELARDSYGGIMIWELGQDVDGPNSLLDAIDSAL